MSTPNRSQHPKRAELSARSSGTADGAANRAARQSVLSSATRSAVQKHLKVFTREELHDLVEKNQVYCEKRIEELFATELVSGVDFVIVEVNRRLSTLEHFAPTPQEVAPGLERSFEPAAPALALS